MIMHQNLPNTMKHLSVKMQKQDR
ncbi:hypothetical protein CIB84_004104 [Bambusicola thoracicus]|uniref:Uncharacterized protein n=1 Tax=Bambusicola thoracicus TaxID=9083 RepID=A0A2P4T700_BAMTH|nr:hypothetical protein CIB84_004104 [Bambusicola thoracicus]